MFTKHKMSLKFEKNTLEIFFDNLIDKKVSIFNISNKETCFIGKLLAVDIQNNFALINGEENCGAIDLTGLAIIPFKEETNNE